jgi:hypothetical protein
MTYTISNYSKLHITVHGYINKREDPVLFLVSEEGGRVIYENFLKELERWEANTVIRNADPLFAAIRRQWLKVADEGSISAM